MNKPFTVKRQEFINGLAELINSSELPPFVIEPILKEFHGYAVNAHEEQYRQEMAQWEKAQEEAKKAEEVDEESEE